MEWWSGGVVVDHLESLCALGSRAETQSMRDNEGGGTDTDGGHPDPGRGQVCQ